MNDELKELLWGVLIASGIVVFIVMLLLAGAGITKVLGM